MNMRCLWREVDGSREVVRERERERERDIEKMVVVLAKCGVEIW
jgi:hypothetical protein